MPLESFRGRFPAVKDTDANDDENARLFNGERELFFSRSFAVLAAVVPDFNMLLLRVRPLPAKPATLRVDSQSALFLPHFKNKKLHVLSTHIMIYTQHKMN